MNEKHLYTTLGATVQSGSVTDETITDSSVIEIYFDEPDVYIKSSSQSGHTVNFTVDGNLTGVNVCVVVNNLTDFVPYDGEGIENQVSALESDIDTITSEIENLTNKVDNLRASNINYDEHSTLYSAMGDIDNLETTSKNLVGAINEIKESGGGGESDIYSLTETPIGTWIDGKTIYRKVIHLSGLSTGEHRYSVDLSMVEKMVKIDAILDNHIINGGNLNSITNWGFCLSDWDINGINMFIGARLQSYATNGLYCILEYTKREA